MKTFLVRPFEEAISKMRKYSQVKFFIMLRFEDLRYLLPSATKLRRLCFYRRLSVHSGGWGWGCLPQCMLGYHTPPPEQTPPEQMPPGSRHTHLPGSRQPPWEQTPPPPGEQTPPRGADTPGSRDPPEQTPPGSRCPPGADTPREQMPPREQAPPPPEIRSLLRTVRILLECILVLSSFHPNLCANTFFLSMR